MLKFKTVMDLPKVTAPKIGVSPKQFLKEARIELKKVKWPSRQEVTKLTGIVLGVSIVVGLFLAGLDFLLTNLMGVIIR